MKAPAPLVIAWQGRRLRVRHDDPYLGPYTPRGAVIRAAVELVSDVAGLRLCEHSRWVWRTTGQLVVRLFHAALETPSRCRRRGRAAEGLTGQLTRHRRHEKRPAPHGTGSALPGPARPYAVVIEEVSLPSRVLRSVFMVAT